MADKSAHHMPIDQLRAMGHPIRFRILEALRGAQANVGEIEAKTGITQPTLSQQLAVLRKCELVGTRRDGKMVIYSINLETVDELLGKVGLFGRATTEEPRNDDRAAASVAHFARLS